jgi:hypothetical protein
MDLVTLSRLNIVEDIDENTPELVLQEIALCHQLPSILCRAPQALIREVRNKPIGVVHNPPHPEDWKTIAYYVNPEQVWSLEQLEIAYEWLRSWETNRALPNDGIAFGPQIPTVPTRCNVCVLYAICKRWGIKTCVSLTTNQLAIICEMISKNDDFSRAVLHTVISNMDTRQMANLYTTILSIENDSDSSTDDSDSTNSVEPVEQIVSAGTLDLYPALQNSIKLMNNVVLLRLQLLPQNNADAIVLAALNFEMDISLSEKPVKEYQHLHRNPGNYCPQDPNLKIIHEFNSQLLSLNHAFNPHFPPELYNDNTIAEMCRSEGYTDLELEVESAYSCMQTAMMSNTFYHGRQLGLQNERTPFLYDELSTLPNEVVVCFGVKGLRDLLGFRYKELSEAFKFSGTFINPLSTNQDVFSIIALRKLKGLCKLIHTADTPETIAEREALYNTIISIELFLDNQQQRAQELYTSHQNANPELKVEIENSIWKLFELSMTMRGWLGQGDYPIERAPVYDETMISLKVTEAMAAFENSCNKLGSLSLMILNLPLLKYSQGEFKMITNNTEGRTIAERLDIVKMGDSHNGWESCIRLSSNLLAVTSWRYMQILQMRLPFRLDRLREIS